MKNLSVWEVKPWAQDHLLCASQAYVHHRKGPSSKSSGSCHHSFNALCRIYGTKPRPKGLPKLIFQHASLHFQYIAAAEKKQNALDIT